MKVLHVVASINRDVGGPAVTVPALAGALAAQGVETTVATLDYPVHGPQASAGGARLASLPAPALARALRGWSPAFARQVGELARQRADIVHGHGLWMFPNLYARQGALAAGRPLVISPRGMLDDWSLRRSRGRKGVAWRLFEADNLAAAKLLHATSDAEARAIRKAGCRQPIAVVPNGVDVPAAGSSPARNVLERAHPELAGRRWLLFLSRLHPKKGVLELVRAWAALEQGFPDWQLIVAGPELDRHGEDVRSLAGALGIAGRVTFPGVLSGDAKECALAHAGLLVLPTHSENFGVVVAEALARGTPVVTTRAAPWQVIEEQHCGWWIDVGEKALRAALQGALRSKPEALKAMGERGRSLVDERYSWAGAACAMRDAYAWLLGAGQRPDCVHTLGA